MGVFGGPNLSEDGLVLALDAGNTKSYPTKNFVSSKIYSVFGASLRSSNYTVQYSDDNSNWTTAFTGVASNNTSCGIQQNTGSGSGSYGLHRYWRYVEGSPIQSHHPRVSRIILTDINGIDYNLVVYTSDNCSDTGTYQVGTVSLDFGGTSWTDISTNGNSGTLVNGVGYSASNGGALSFDGSNDYVLLTRNDFNTSLPNFTISVFVYKISDGIILGNHRHNQTWESVWISTTEFTVNDTNGTANRQSLYHTTPINSWMNLVAVNNSSQNYMKVFLNGAEIATKTATVIPWNSSIIPTIGANLLVGDLSPVGPINGRISNTTIYNRALTAAEISQNFNALRGRFGI